MGSCTDCFFGSIYATFWILLHLCPVIGQILALRIWLSKDKYLNSQNPSDRMAGHLGLILGTYVIGYLLYIIIKAYFHAWEYCVNNYNSGLVQKLESSSFHLVPIPSISFSEDGFYC